MRRERAGVTGEDALPNGEVHRETEPARERQEAAIRGGVEARLDLYGTDRAGGRLLTLRRDAVQRTAGVDREVVPPDMLLPLHSRRKQPRFETGCP
mgnify:CR=1 FL=1